MDHNNNMNEMKEPTKKENPFKDWKFYMAYFITIIILGATSFLLAKINGIYWILAPLVFCIPYLIVCVIIWSIVRSKNRSVALGILFGSLTPFIALFIAIGGCMVFMF